MKRKDVWNKELLKKFPSLTNFFDGKENPSLDEFDTVQWKVFDRNLLAVTPWRHIYSHTWGFSLEYEKAAVIATDGEITPLGFFDTKDSEDIHEENRETPADPIGKQLVDLGFTASNIKAIVVWEAEGVTFDNDGVRRLVIYKNKGNITLRK